MEWTDATPQALSVDAPLENENKVVKSYQHFQNQGRVKQNLTEHAYWAIACKVVEIMKKYILFLYL